jgi:hypothetical protein
MYHLHSYTIWGMGHIEREKNGFKRNVADFDGIMPGYRQPPD